MAADIASRLGSFGRRPAQGFLSNACEETTREFEHAKRARRDGCESVIDRYNKERVYAARMDANGDNKNGVGMGVIVLDTRSEPAYHSSLTSRSRVHTRSGTADRLRQRSKHSAAPLELSGAEFRRRS